MRLREKIICVELLWLITTAEFSCYDRGILCQKLWKSKIQHEEVLNQNGLHTEKGPRGGGLSRGGAAIKRKKYKMESY